MPFPERLYEVEDRISRACARSHRRRDEITLIAVTKFFPASALREAYDAGLRNFGENYVQEFDRKLPDAGPLPDARFHLIGHLQSNKARRAVELFHVIQTVDSTRLAQRLDEAAAGEIEVMLEVKLGDEQAKSGSSPEELPALVDAVRACPRLRLTGLMTMPPWSDDPEAPRPYFARLRDLAARFNLGQLSMGMSGDLETAIEEGATHIRVGTALFGRRTPA